MSHSSNIPYNFSFVFVTQRKMFIVNTNIEAVGFCLFVTFYQQTPFGMYAGSSI